MKIIFLGTSSGTPTKNRNVSAQIIKRAQSKQWSLVDCGEGTQHRLLHTRLSLHHLHTIYITHVHGDHCYGLPGLLATASMSGRKSPLRMVAPGGIQVLIETVLQTTDLRISYPLQFVPIEEITERWDGGEFDVEIRALSHRVPSYAFGFYEKPGARKLDIEKLAADNIPSGPHWGQIQKGENVMLSDGRYIHAEQYLVAPPAPRKIIIAGDNDKPALLEDCAKDANVLVHEATYTDEVAQRVGPRPQHSSAKTVAQFAEQTQLPNLVLTHFSPRYQDDGSDSPLRQLEEEARAYYHGHLFLACDLCVYRLNQEGVLQKQDKQAAGDSWETASKG